MRQRAVSPSLRSVTNREALLRGQIRELGGQFASLCAAMPQEPRTFDSLPSEVLTLVAESLAKKDTRLGKDKVWAELSLEEQAAVETLGYTEECWDHGLGTLGYTEEGVPIEGRGWLLAWAEMGAAETSAAITLGYEQSSWDYEQEADPSLLLEGWPIDHPNGLYARVAVPPRGLLQGHSSLANFAAASKTCLAAAHMELYEAKGLRHSQLSEHVRASDQLISDLRDQADQQGSAPGSGSLLAYVLISRLYHTWALPRPSVPRPRGSFDEVSGKDVSSLLDGLDAIRADQARLLGVDAHETGATARMRVVHMTGRTLRPVVDYPRPPGERPGILPQRHHG